MGTIATSIMINDRVSGPLRSVAQSLNTVISGFEKANAQSHLNIDTGPMRSSLGQLNAQLETLGNEAEEAGEKAEDAGKKASQSATNLQNPLQGLMGTIRNLVGAYVGLQGIRSVLNMSDELASTNARLQQMNQGFSEAGKQARNAADSTSLIYQAAQDSRSSFADMSALVARFGNNARDAFSGTDEVIKFADIVGKQMAIAGASTEEASNAELQLSQALGSGVLRGDELNSIFENAPNLIQSIADYMGKPIGKIRDMAKDGEITADIVKNAVLQSSDEVNKKFEQMPMTWGQVWTKMQNTALMAFQPVLDRINKLANSEGFQNFIDGVLNGLAQIATMVLNVMDTIGKVATFVQQNWNVIGPIVEAAVLAIGGMALAWGIYTLATRIAAASTMLPLIAIGLVIAAVWLVANTIANMTGVANSALGVIAGGVAALGAIIANIGLAIANVVVAVVTTAQALFYNLGTFILNLISALRNAFVALGHNIVTAFHNSIANVQTFFYNLLSTALTVVSRIANALNRLPFVNIDVSGLDAAASNYAGRAQEAQDSRGEYKSIAGEFNKGMNSNSYENIGKTWNKGMNTAGYFNVNGAFKAGSAWGDGVNKKVKGLGKGKISVAALTGSDAKLSDVMKGNNGTAAKNAGDTKKNTGKTAKHAGKISKKLDVTNDQLKYMRELNERRAINRFTTRDVKIVTNNKNTISSDVDSSKFIDELVGRMQTAMESDAEEAMA